MTLLIIRLKNTTTYDLRYGVGEGYPSPPMRREREKREGTKKGRREKKGVEREKREGTKKGRREKKGRRKELIILLKIILF